MKFWIDTDPGVDDALAIILAVKYLGGDVVGFSSGQGNFAETITARNLARIINKLKTERLAPEHWTPVIARGSQLSLSGVSYRGLDYPGDHYHGKDGLGNVDWMPINGWQAITLAAAEAIVTAARQYNDLHLFCIGPLTNIALALQLEPDLPKLIARITIMGGNINVGGNETLHAEFNFVADPTAAAFVLAAGFNDLQLIPIDPCLDAMLSYREKEIIAACPSATAKLLGDLLKLWDGPLTAGNEIAIYDAVALMVIMFPELANWELLAVSIDANDRPGQVLLGHLANQKQPNATVATGIVNRNDFYQQLFRLL